MLRRDRPGSENAPRIFTLDHGGVVSSQPVDSLGELAPRSAVGLEFDLAAIVAAAQAIPPEQAQAVLGALFASLPLGAAVIDASDQVEISFGEPMHLLSDLQVGQKVTSGHLATLLTAVRSQGRSTGEGVYDGNVLCLTATALSDGRVVLVAHDVTEQRRAEGELIQARAIAELASRSKSIFLANMSHELRTPLNAIIGFADLMRQGYFGTIGNDRYREYLGDIRESGAHLLSLISDLLDISRIEAGQYRLQEEVVDLPTEIAAAVRFLRELATKSGVAVETLMSTVPPIWAETRAIRQILINLIGNAMKFTRPGGRIIVSAQLVDGCPVLSVRDTGIGMDEPMRRHLESGLGGYRADSKMAGQGTGLGLPIVRSLVAIHGGVVEIRSRPGEGTTVTVTLPATRAMPLNSGYGLRPWEVRDDEESLG